MGAQSPNVDESSVEPDAKLPQCGATYFGEIQAAE